MKRNKKIVFVVSGEGWLFSETYQACLNDYLPVEIVALVSNNENSGVILKAKEFNIDSYYIDTKNKTKDEYSNDIDKIISSYKADYIVTMFNRLFSHKFVHSNKNKCINLHLSLLPSFGGMNPRESALEYGVKYSGATIHFIDDGIDSGPIISQMIFPIKDNTTIDDLYREYGKRLPIFLLNSLNYIFEEKYEIIGRKVILESANYDSLEYSPSISEKFKKWMK